MGYETEAGSTMSDAPNAGAPETAAPPRRWRGWRVVRIITLGVVLAPFLAAIYALTIEPTWLAERTVTLARPPAVRILHFTDIHHRGDRAYLERVVARINASSADLVCFTGDLVEEESYLSEALQILSQIKKPMYGIRGNHDRWDDAEIAQVEACFQATGGRWLVDQRAVALGGRVELIGSSGQTDGLGTPSADRTQRHVLLVHNPKFVESLSAVHFDLILAGHTHGGQIRIPGRGPPVELSQVGRYDRGLFATPVGPLYVNPGIGTYWISVRFWCRPELTLLEL